jgi:hypothetical protein
VLSRVLCATAEDDITIIVKATATPVAYRPLLRMFMISSFAATASHRTAANAVVERLEVGRRRAILCATARRPEFAQAAPSPRATGLDGLRVLSVFLCLGMSRSGNRSRVTENCDQLTNSEFMPTI